MPPNHNRTPRPDSCPVEGQCIFEQQKDVWLDSKFLKTAGVIVGLLSPLFVWIVIEIFTLKGNIAVQNEKIGTLLEIKQDISSIRNDIGQLKTDVAILKSKGTP